MSSICICPLLAISWCKVMRTSGRQVFGRLPDDIRKTLFRGKPCGMLRRCTESPSYNQRVELERGPLSQITPMPLEKGVRRARAKTVQAHQELPLWIEFAARPTAVGSLIGSDAMDVQVADPVEYVLAEAMVGRFLRQGALEKSQILELLQQACVEGNLIEPARNIGRVAGAVFT